MTGRYAEASQKHSEDNNAARVSLIKIGNKTWTHVVQTVHSCDFPEWFIRQIKLLKTGHPPKTHPWIICQQSIKDPTWLQSQQSSLSITLRGDEMYKITRNAQAFLASCGHWQKPWINQPMELWCQSLITSRVSESLSRYAAAVGGS